jgi:hypothetical protein
MRARVIVLILVNLAFAAWALLIDRPVSPPAARDISHLPLLVLVNSGSAPASAQAPVAAPSRPAAATHCVTVGPFSDLAIAAAASALLQSRGFTPTQRDEPGADLVTYWVHLDNVASEAEVTRVLRKLHGSGLADAHVMPFSGNEARRLSVGLFNEHDGAERRAHEVKNLGLTPVITEQHQSQASYWVDINLATQVQTISTEGLLPPAAEGAHLEIRACPVAASSAPAPAGSAPSPAGSAPAPASSQPK